MGYRLSWIVGTTAVTVSLFRLARLLRSSEVGPSWQAVLLASFLLGLVVTWAATTYRLSTPAILLVNAIGFVVATGLIVAPETVTFGFIPTADTANALAEELGFAVELIRYGSAPVVPVGGLVAVIAWVYWSCGMLLTWALSNGRPLLGLLPPLLFYLQLATIDRASSGWIWPLVFMVLLAAALGAAVLDERSRGMGRLRSTRGNLVPRTAYALPVLFLGVLVLSSVAGGLTIDESVPEQGLLDWRTRNGIGNGISGGVSYNLFVSTVQTDLLTLSEEPVFVARVGDDVDASDLYWRLITLEKYDGTNWYPGALPTKRDEPGSPWERGDHAYQGNTRIVDQVIRIESLRQNYLPAAYSPIDMLTSNDLLDQTFEIREDGALNFDALTFRGLQYSIRSEVPNDSLAALASVGGQLSPMFALAADDGQFLGAPSPQTLPRLRPQNIAEYLALPEEVEVRIKDLAEEITANGTTDFERALLLEAFYRDSGEFRYTVDIDAGHAATDLAAWLFDPESPNFRRGYCEQFATGMAVMARMVEIPSRVVLGFTPGEAGPDGVNVVRQRNAHAWVELWIDNHGWTRFDPTPRGDGINPATVEDLAFEPRDYALALAPLQTVIDPRVDPDAFSGVPLFGPNQLPLQEYLASLDEFAGTEGSSQSPVSNDSGFSLPDWFWRVPAALSLFALVPLFKLIRRRVRMYRIHRGNIDAAWQEIVDRLTDLQQPISGDRTPLEVAQQVEPSLTPLAMVRTKQTFAATAELTHREVSQGMRSFSATETALRNRYGRWARFRSWWTLRSLRRL